MPFKLPELPYPANALEPFMSAETLEFHHGKHHKAYVYKANELLEGRGDPGRSLVETIRKARQDEELKLFNQVAQIWNHSFFWQCLAPAGQKPAGQLAGMIDDAFGSLDSFLEEFTKEAVAHFASGWAWLVLDGERLKITSFHDADTPVARDKLKPLFTLDVWEHAYYIDYRNARPKFADEVLRNIVNWEFVALNLDGRGAERADQRAEAREPAAT